MVNKISSNSTGCFIAEEVQGTPKTLPGTPVWLEREPNNYNNFGAEVQTVARDPISIKRQRKRGTVVDVDASGGIVEDFTQNNMNTLLQGFVFADAHEKADTQALNATAVAITAVDGANDRYEAASGLDDFASGDIVYASGFGVSGNNGMKVLSAASASALDTDTALTAEASPPAAARVQVVGFQFASGDATMSVTGGQATFGATSKDLTELGLQVGEWVFVGGDDAGDRFATCPVGYARVSSISAAEIVFDKVTGTFATDSGTGKTIQLFFGQFLRNEATEALIKTRTYQIERQLGNDGVGVQASYLKGAVANEFVLNVPETDKVTADLNYLAMDEEYRSGTEGVKSGTRVASLGEDPFNTSSNAYRMYMNILDPNTLQPTALFAFLTDMTININNNASLDKAIGVIGAFDITVGNFEVGGSVDAYFTDVASVSAIRNNSEVTMDLIMAKNNAGAIFDLPSVTLGGGRVNVEKDVAIKLPLETLASEGAAGYTLGVNYFPYLPTQAMAT